MTPLDAETQRILAIYDEWLACKCGEYERWAEDGAGRCKHERALHYEAETACELIRELSARVDMCFEDAEIALETARKEERERCARVCEELYAGHPRKPLKIIMTAMACAETIRSLGDGR